MDGQRAALAKTDADLDIGVKPAGALRIKEKASIALELEELFSARRVDLVAVPEADPFLAGDLAPLERERLSLLEKR